jgi:hypothetical protein
LQHAGIDVRYLRRARWIAKAQAVRQNRARLRDHLAFIAWAPEPDNFTYEIANQDELAHWVATVGRADQAVARRYIAEAEADAVLASRLHAATRRHWLWVKREPPFGRRLGWYALARILKPELVIETGVHDGLGSLLLLRALERNRADGSDGRLVSFEVNPAGGWLVGQHSQWELRVQSSEDGLPEVLADASPVGMYVYDGWHTHDDELAELKTVAPHLASAGVLLSDDAQVTKALAEFCRQADYEYHEFQEHPTGHFYPGAVLGAGRSRLA